MITFNSNELKFNDNGTMTPLPYFSNATASSLDARLTSAESNITALQSGKMDEWTLLWTNASLSSFAPQTISLDLSQYSAVVIYIISAGSTAYYRNSAMCLNNTISTLICVDIFSYVREAQISNSGIQFNNCYKIANYGSSSSVDNGWCIPYKIYGIK